MGPFRLVLGKKSFGYGLYMPYRESWGYEQFFLLKKCFCETPYWGALRPLCRVHHHENNSLLVCAALFSFPQPPSLARQKPSIRITNLPASSSSSSLLVSLSSSSLSASMSLLWLPGYNFFWGGLSGHKFIFYREIKFWQIVCCKCSRVLFSSTFSQKLLRCWQADISLPFRADYPN